MTDTSPLTVADRVVRWESGSRAWACPCGCETPDVAIARFDDGIVRYCTPCLQAGYACRLREVRHG